MKNTENKEILYNSDSTPFIAFLHWLTPEGQFSGGEHFQS
jgi:hypothetical protein